MSETESEPVPRIPRHDRFQFVRCIVLAVALISMLYGLSKAMKQRRAIVLKASTRWSDGLSNELASYPLSKSVPSSVPSFDIDADKPWKIEFGRGSGGDGLDTATLMHDGTVILYRLTWKPKSGYVASNWETAKMTLSREAVSNILVAVSGNRLTKLQKAYHAAVQDGTQWILWISQGANEKSVYFNNHFPDEIVGFADSLDAVLSQNGVGSVKWSRVPTALERKHEDGLWDSLKR